MVQITRFQKAPDGNAIFFDVLFQLSAGDEKAAVIIPGFKAADGRLWTPSKKSGGVWYQTAFVSPATAREIAAKAILVPEIAEFLEPDGWVAAKWGKSGLSAVTESAELMKDIYDYYKSG